MCSYLGTIFQSERLRVREEFISESSLGVCQAMVDVQDCDFSLGYGCNLDRVNHTSFPMLVAIVWLLYTGSVWCSVIQVYLNKPLHYGHTCHMHPCSYGPKFSYQLFVECTLSHSWDTSGPSLVRYDIHTKTNLLVQYFQTRVKSFSPSFDM